MKKVLILFVFMLFLTGCSATYDVEIYNNRVKEKLEYVNNNSSTWQEIVDGNMTYKAAVEDSINYPYPAFYDSLPNEDDYKKAKGVEYYKNKLISDSYKLGQQLSYNKFKLDNYNRSNIITRCYKYFNVLNEEDRIVISTSKENTCFDKYEKLDNLIINLKTNHKVISHNASRVDGYHYTWNITRDNKDNANISIILSKNDYIFNYENEFIKNILTIGGIAVIIVCVIGGTYLHFKNKRENLNKI